MFFVRKRVHTFKKKERKKKERKKLDEIIFFCRLPLSTHALIHLLLHVNAQTQTHKAQQQKTCRAECRTGSKPCSRCSLSFVLSLSFSSASSPFCCCCCVLLFFSPPSSMMSRVNAPRDDDLFLFFFFFCCSVNKILTTTTKWSLPSLLSLLI